MKHYLVTGGTGFVGSALVRHLVHAGHYVRVLDNNWRGNAARLKDVIHDVEYLEADVRDAATVERACRGVESVVHLAAINGTTFFYSQPELVLEVAVKGIMNVVDGCVRAGVPELFLASSSEVYQDAPRLPTDEAVPLSIPDPLNPRYAYASGKLVSELVVINFGRKHLQRAVVFRPHNVYGPDMGVEHVIPQFVLRMKKVARQEGRVRFPIQGTGRETRSFVFIDDCVKGILTLLERGKHLNIYHIGTNEEVSMERLAQIIAGYFHKEIEVVPGPSPLGSAHRRCPDVTKLSQLGYRPKVTLEQGLARTVSWYLQHASEESPAP